MLVGEPFPKDGLCSLTHDAALPVVLRLKRKETAARHRGDGCLMVLAMAAGAIHDCVPERQPELL